MAKRALQGQKEPFLIEQHGSVVVWDFFAEEIVDAANRASRNELARTSSEQLVLRNIRQWMVRYLEEGITDKLLDDINAALHEIRYAKYVFPLDILPSEIGVPRNGYVAKYDKVPSPVAIAADDFSKLLTSGALKRLRQCRLKECENFFLGPPQAKWCSKTCGSKFRVRKKRKRDSA